MGEGKIHIRRGPELEQLREAGRTAAEILKLTASAVVPGATTLEVEELAVSLMRERNCRSAFHRYRKFPGHICISINEEVVHGIASASRTIQPGDIVKIDVGIVRNGWVGDNAMTVPVGEVAARTLHLLWATEEALQVGVQYAREGKRLGDLCAAIERTVKGNRYSVVEEFVGHGVGRRLHEPPQIPNHGTPGQGPRLRAGMVLAIEPMVNLGTKRVQILADNWTVKTLDGQPSAHFEHMVLVTKGDPEILTPRERLFTVEPQTADPAAGVATAG
jgi:methionyl aminopeptidase